MELKQAAEMIPNQAMLINTLPLLESQASSEIENIVTTTDQLFEHQHRDEQADPATNEPLPAKQMQTLQQTWLPNHTLRQLIPEDTSIADLSGLGKSTFSTPAKTVALIIKRSDPVHTRHAPA